MAQKTIILTLETIPSGTKPSLGESHGYNSGEEKQDIEVKDATVRISQTDKTTSSRKPCFEFDISYKVGKDKEAVILEWANCFWSKNKFAERILRQATLKFDYASYDITMPQRTFTIAQAFLAKYEESMSEDGGPDEKEVKIIIRANEQDQEIIMEQTPPPTSGR